MTGVQACIALAGASYLGSCGWGAAAVLARPSSVRAHPVHHVLFIVTCTLLAVAVSSLLWSSSRAAWFLVPAAVPLAALPVTGSRSILRHALIALAASPFYLISILIAWR